MSRTFNFLRPHRTSSLQALVSILNVVLQLSLLVVRVVHDVLLLAVLRVLPSRNARPLGAISRDCKLNAISRKDNSHRISRSRTRLQQDALYPSFDIVHILVVAVLVLK